MAGLLPGGANWCTIATWASRQAGQSIRQKDLQRTLARLLRESREAEEALQALETEGVAIREDETESLSGAISALRDALSPSGAFNRNSQAVARGNLKVFEEIGLHFARFLALYASGSSDQQALDKFLDGLNPGEPPDGQRYLHQAFTHYNRAINTPDEKERAEWMLLANLEIGFHEQARLQPEILEAMNAPIYDPAALRRRLVDELFPDSQSRIRYLIARAQGRAGRLITARDQLAKEAQRLGRQVITEYLMTLELSGGKTVFLGKDLAVAFPPILKNITLEELKGLLVQVDLTPDSLAGTGTKDWSQLPHRLHFIADLFRAFHQDLSLFDRPFTTDQVADLKAGKRPQDI
jgi:hypothetical protein